MPPDQPGLFFYLRVVGEVAEWGLRRPRPLPGGARKRDLNVDAVRVLDVQPGIVALQRRRAALLEMSFNRIPVKMGNADRVVIDEPAGAAVIEGDHDVLVAETDDLGRLFPGSRR